MKENKYDDPIFFTQYSQMPRSIGGLEAAGEWHALKKLLPDFTSKRVLDLGCGFGWHCHYAVEHGASRVVGIDLSENMLCVAHEKNASPLIQYIQMSIEEIDFAPETFDIVISSLAFHYVESFDDVFKRVHRCLTSEGDFIFSVEHPIFTAQGTQDWYYDANDTRLHWPVDQYFQEGKRDALFLGEHVVKYHRTLTSYVNGLMHNGFSLTGLVEPTPQDDSPQMQDEWRRPMMLILRAKKD